MKILITEQQIKEIIKNVYGNLLSEQIAPLNVWLNLQELLNKNKPSNTMVHLSKDGKAFFLDRYIAKGQLGFSNTGLVTIYNGTSWTPIGKWDPKMNTNGKLYGSWLSQNNGTKINLSTALAQPNFLIPSMMISVWNNKKTSATPITKSKNYPYTELKNNPTPQFIAKVIKESKGTFDDSEAWVEAAFMAIKTTDMYNKVKAALGQDPYKFAASFMDVNEKYHVQAVGVSYKLMGTSNQNVTTKNFGSKCPLILTVAKPAGKKTNNAPVDIFRYWGKDKNGNHKDPLLYTNHLTGLYAKVPVDFGWKLNNNIYPYPTLYPQACINTSGKWAKEQEALPIFARANSQLNEYIDPAYSVQKSDNTSVSKSYLGYQTNKNPMDVQSDKTNKYNQSIGKEMINFNNALIKQKELIPKYCQTPLNRHGKKTFEKLETFHFVSMYNLCRDFGGLWVYGVGTSEYKCGCRDMSNASLTMNIESSTGDINIGNTISDIQTSRNWSHTDSQDMILNTIAFASAFIPVVGPFITFGLGSLQAAKHWKQGKQADAAVDIIFSLLPMLNKIPGVSKISTSIATSLGNKIVSSGALTLEELNTLKKITQYDKQISTELLSTLERQSAGKIKDHVIKTAVKKAEGEIIDYTGLPTRTKVKKAIASKALTSTTKLT